MIAATVIGQSELPRHEADRLLRTVTGATRSSLLDGFELNDRQVSRFDELAQRRLRGEPLQYLEGKVAFGPIEVAVDSRVLIPRPETEQLWERAIALLAQCAGIVVDLGTGSGCIALAIKHRCRDLHVIATDISDEALSLARKNAEALALDVEFGRGDLFDALDPQLHGRVHLIVSNPPYVTADEWDRLDAEIRVFEPRQALVAAEEGLAFYRRLAESSGEWLRPGGVVIAEIGETQGEAVSALFVQRGWEASIDQDLNQRDRFVTARVRQ